MAGPRRFDHDEARRRHAAGETMAALAREFGVTTEAVRRAVNPKASEAARAYGVLWHSSGRCPNCGGPSTRLSARGSYRCRACFVKAQTKVRDGQAFCSDCKTWKPLTDFSPSNRSALRGVHGQCRSCDTARRKAWREANRERDRANDRASKRRAKATRA